MDIKEIFYYAVLVILVQVQRRSRSQFYPPYPQYDVHNNQPPPTLGGNADYFNRRQIDPPLRHLHYAYQEPVVQMQYYQVGPNPSGYQQHFKDATPYYSSKLEEADQSRSQYTQIDSSRDLSKDSENVRVIIGDDNLDISFDRRKGFSINNHQLNHYGQSMGGSVVVVIYRPRQCPMDDQRIYRKDGKCYTILRKDQNPCGRWMKFYPEKDNYLYGDCDCDFDNGIVSRPIAYWRPHDRCYLLFHRGPCRQYEWFVLDKQGFPRCIRRNQNCSTGSNDGSIFYFVFNGTCYETGKYYSKLCPSSSSSYSEGKNHWKVYFPAGKNKPECLESEPKVGEERYLLGPAQELRCKAGYKKMQNGECNRKITFDNDY